MNFRDEYKKSAESLSPDRKTIDRMKAAVMAEINSGAAEEPKPRKPLLLNRIALIGGAAAACAIITVSAVNFIPKMMNSNDMVSEADISSSAAAAEINSAESAFTTSSEYSSISDSASLDHNGAIKDNDFIEDFTDESVLENADDVISTDTSIPNMGIAGLPNTKDNNPNAASSDISKEPSDNGLSLVTMEEYVSEEDDVLDNSSTGEGETGEGGLTCEPGMFTGETCLTEECGYDETAECTEEPDFNPDETCEVVSEEPCIEHTIVLTDKGWLTCDDIRFNQLENAQDPGYFGQTVLAYNESDRKYYAVYIADDVLYLYQNDGKFLGAFAQQN